MCYTADPLHFIYLSFPVQANLLFPYVKEFRDLWEVTARCSKHHVTYSKGTGAVLSYLTKILAFSIQSINL